jgi:hypothetical protein
MCVAACGHPSQRDTSKHVPSMCHPHSWCGYISLLPGQLAFHDRLLRLILLQGAGVTLTGRSIDLLALQTTQERTAYIQQTQGQPLAQSTVITCMTSMRQSLDEVRHHSCPKP